MSDILAGQGADPAVLAALYDLEHDEVTEDLPFWTQIAALHAGATLDLGCGSGRLFRTLVDGGARPLIGLDGSPALLARAERRIAADDVLGRAAGEGWLRLVPGDATSPRLATPAPRGGFRLVVVAGVMPHLRGPEEALRMLEDVARLLAPDGRVVIDDLGPGRLPARDLPLSVDWERGSGADRVVRRSQLTRNESPDGLRVAYATITDTVRADGTIARLPASFRLWYPSRATLDDLVEAAGLSVELTWGSYDLESYDPLDSERRILVAQRVGDRQDSPAATGQQGSTREWAENRSDSS
ncbi:MAG TPA: class I SAM-dependent methyltransferase [Candidatus Limnocylindria bacterium]|nr:class I SAM-dependent methyltransferase [Candidatus Limnocylindria bacterium]